MSRVTERSRWHQTRERPGCTPTVRAPGCGAAPRRFRAGAVRLLRRAGTQRHGERDAPHPVRLEYVSRELRNHCRHALADHVELWTQSDRDERCDGHPPTQGRAGAPAILPPTDSTMIDLHAHVLPALDDGPSNEGAALDLLRSAGAAGTRIIAATPHLRNDFPAVRVEQLASACARLRERLGDDQVGPELVVGGEVDIHWALSASDEQLRLASYCQRGNDLLVETPYAPLTPAFEDTLFRVAARGYRVLLAHPERNPSFQRDPGRLEALVARGTLLQLTASSLLSSRRRSPSRALAHHLVRRRLAHVLASDAHSAGPWRPPHLAGGVDVVAKLDGDLAAWMVGAAPEAIMAGESLPQLPPRAETRSVLGRRRRQSGG